MPVPSTALIASRACPLPQGAGEVHAFVFQPQKKRRAVAAGRFFEVT